MKTKILLLILFLFIPLITYADGGMIVWPRQIHLDETAQNAIVAWNGQEEIIILSNDIESDGEAVALRMIPFPSNPEITEGNFESFEKITEIVNEKIEEIWGHGYPGSTTDEGKLGANRAEVEIVFQEQIGAHDLTTVKVNDLDYFLNWIKEFAEGKELEIKEISQDFKEGISNYMKRDIRYFVFDVINTKETKESINPLAYRFDSDYLYYPLRITAVSEIEDSYGRIQLFLIAKEFSGKEFEYEYPVEFTQEELSEVNEEIANLFEENVEVLSVDFYGRFSNYPEDLILYPSNLWQRDLTLGSSGREVKMLQNYLINYDFWESDVEATGYFGPITQRALIKFQEAEKYEILKPLGLENGTGYFGEKTKKYFEKISVEREKKSEIVISQWSRDLFLSISGDDVKELQQLLINENVWQRPDIEPTGYFGPITQQAVIRFQDKYASEILEPVGLSNGTGFVGPSTREFLNKQ